MTSTSATCGGRSASDFFLEAGIEWVRVADAVRGIPSGDEPLRAVALGLWREAAWCHVLFTAGKNTALLTRLRTILAEAGLDPVQQSGGDEVLAAAADIFGRLRLAVADRYPDVFGLARQSA
jgi:hypothetical protein